MVMVYKRMGLGLAITKLALSTSGRTGAQLNNDSGQVVHTLVPLSHQSSETTQVCLPATVCKTAVLAHKKLCYSRRTARRAMSAKILSTV